MKEIYWAQPDVALELLRNGYARLKEQSSAPLAYQEAELDARAAGKGLWESKASPPELINSGDSNWPDWPELKISILRWIDLYGGISAVIGAIIATISIIIRFTRRRRMPLLFLGPQGVGKSWLWSRIRNPDIDEDALRKIPRTDSTKRPKNVNTEPMGPYVVTPIYIDTPGGQPGAQTTELLRKSRLVRQKVVWIITLSTTQEAVTHKSSEAEKIDNEYIYEQLGYLGQQYT